jgi:hypothetical protein
VLGAENSAAGTGPSLGRWSPVETARIQAASVPKTIEIDNMASKNSGNFANDGEKAPEAGRQGRQR